jgi:Uma2 family endonuclease
VTELLVQLHRACPDGLEVLPAPVGWYISEHTVFEPDVVLVRQLDQSAPHIDEPPLLAIEVLSPSTKLRDLGLKRRYYGDRVALVLDRQPGDASSDRAPVGRRSFRRTRRRRG